MKKLVFTIGNLGVGGAPKMLCYVANLSTRYFSDVSIVVLRKNEHVYQLCEQIKVMELDLEYGKKRKFNDFLIRCSKLSKVLKQLNPDIIIAFVNPIIIYSYFARKRKVILVGADRGNPEALPQIHRILARFVYPRCDMMIFQSEGALSCFNQKVKKKSFVIANPYMPSGKDPGCYCGKRKKTIVSTSRLGQEKNIDVLIQAFVKSSAAESYQLIIYGNGTEEKRLKDLAGELDKNSCIKFVGTTHEIMLAIQDAGMFALVSDNEGMPNGLIEAMALGIPCITTKCMAGDTNSLIEHLKNGLIVEKGDVEDLRSAIDYFYNYPEEAERMGKEAAKVRSLLDESVIQKKWGEVFRRLVENKRS